MFQKPAGQFDKTAPQIDGLSRRHARSPIPPRRLHSHQFHARPLGRHAMEGRPERTPRRATNPVPPTQS